MTALIGKMKDVLKATRTGRLVEATALICESLARRILEPDGRGYRPAKGRVSDPERYLNGVTQGVGRIMPAPASPSSQPGPTFAWHVVGSGAESRRYKLYVPAACGSSPMPLVVMLHGCTQTPDDFAVGTRMNELADAMGFLVAYPEQPVSANASRCWNWFRPSDQAHGRGEPALIAEMTRRITREHQVAQNRVFVAGLSAGGAAAAAIMGQAYPDLFAGVGVHSGLACGAASDVMSAFTAMRGGSASLSADIGRTVPTIVFHGPADRTVNPANAAGVARQAGGKATPVEVRGRSTDGTSFTRRVFADAAGRSVVEEWAIDGAGHAWSGGSPKGSYAVASGTDASREMLRFFGLRLSTA